MSASTKTHHVLLTDYEAANINRLHFGNQVIIGAMFLSYKDEGRAALVFGPGNAEALATELEAFDAVAHLGHLVRVQVQEEN